MDAQSWEKLWVEYPPGDAPGRDLGIVLVSGDGCVSRAASTPPDRPHAHRRHCKHCPGQQARSKLTEHAHGLAQGRVEPPVDRAKALLGSCIFPGSCHL